MKLFNREIRQHRLESAERIAGIVQVLFILNGIVCGSAADVIIDAPVIAVVIDEKALAVDRRNHGQRFAGGVAAGCCDFLMQKFGHGADIFHHQLRLLKNVLIDLL